MYRKNQREKMDPKQENPGFFNRLAELPMSRAALEQLFTLYEKAQQQKLLAMGIKAGESTFKLAGIVASPVINKLPVETLDNMACKQLDRLEQAVPGIKKEPKEILAASEEMYNKAKALPSNTVQAVKDAGVKSVNEVKSYAVETVTPTIERVDKVKTYSVEKVHVATEYSKEKIEGVKSTYNSVKSGELIGSCYNSVKGGVVHKYEGVKEGIVHKYDGVVSGVTVVTSGVASGYGKAKQELYNYTSQTLEPTVSRCTAVKTYGAEKVHVGTSLATTTYTGLKDITSSLVNTITNNQLVKSVQNNGLVSSLNNSVIGLIGYADRSVDDLLPPQKGCEGHELDPASPEAGTWTRTMILVTKLKGRIYHSGQQRIKPYITQAEDMANSVKNFKKTSTDYVTNAYSSTTNYFSQTYNNGHEYVTTTYNSVIDRYSGAVTRSKDLYGNLGNNATKVWTTTTTMAVSWFGYVTESVSFATDYTMKTFPVNKWLGNERRIQEEAEIETSIMRPVAAEE